MVKKVFIFMACFFASSYVFYYLHVLALGFIWQDMASFTTMVSKTVSVVLIAKIVLGSFSKLKAMSIYQAMFVIFIAMILHLIVSLILTGVGVFIVKLTGITNANHLIIANIVIVVLNLVAVKVKGEKK